MIVLDASIVVELLTNGPLAGELRRDLSSRQDPLLIPYLLDVEVIGAIRSLVAGRRVDSHRVAQLIVALSQIPAERYPHAPLLPRVWELRHKFTAYDSIYIALAEQTQSVLYTADAKLTHGHNARVRLFQEDPH